MQSPSPYGSAYRATQSYPKGFRNFLLVRRSETTDVLSTFFSFPTTQQNFSPSVFGLESYITHFPKTLSVAHGLSRPEGLSALGKSRSHHPSQLMSKDGPGVPTPEKEGEFGARNLAGCTTQVS